MMVSSSTIAAVAVARASSPPTNASSTPPSAGRSTHPRSVGDGMARAIGHTDTPPPRPRRLTLNRSDDDRTSTRRPVPPARTSGRVKPLTRKVTDPAGATDVVVDGAGVTVVDEAGT